MVLPRILREGEEAGELKAALLSFYNGPSLVKPGPLARQLLVAAVDLPRFSGHAPSEEVGGDDAHPSKTSIQRGV